MNTKNKLDKLVTSNYKKYLQYATNMTNGIEDPRDVLQECIMEIYELDETKIKEILPYFEFYLIQMIKYSFRSKTSKYQQKYNKVVFDKNIDIEVLLDIPEETPVDEITIEDIEKVLNNECSWYEREVFTQYVNSKKSFKTFEKETGIPSASLYKTYIKVKKTLQQNLYLIKK